MRLRRSRLSSGYTRLSAGVCGDPCCVPVAGGGCDCGACATMGDIGFVDVASLQMCPQTNAQGWCRTSTGGVIKPSVAAQPMSTTKKVAIAGAGLLALYLLTR